MLVGFSSLRGGIPPLQVMLTLFTILQFTIFRSYRFAQKLPRYRAQKLSRKTLSTLPIGRLTRKMHYIR